MISEKLFKTRGKRRVLPFKIVFHSIECYRGNRIPLCLCCENNGCGNKRKKCSEKNLCLSLEAIPQEVFCASKITRSSVSAVCYTMCALVWRTFSKFAGIRRKRCSVNKKDSKGRSVM